MVKVVSLSDEAYRTLRALKGLKSFSDIVLELAAHRSKKKKSIMDFYGAFADNAAEWEEIEKKIYEDRKRVKMRDVHL